MKGLTSLMIRTQIQDVIGVRRELILNPGSINVETLSGKTALFFAIDYLRHNHGTAIANGVPDNRMWVICRELIEHNARIGRWCHFKIPDFIARYMQKIRFRRRACSATLRTLIGLKRFKRAPHIFDGANKDVMFLITLSMMREAGKRVEWDYDEIERAKKILK